MPVIIFLSKIITRIGNLVVAKWAAGALKTTVIFTTMLVAMSTAVFSLVAYANNILLEWANNLSPVGQNLMIGIAAFLPSNMPYLVSALLSYYAFSATTHLAIEVIKMKAVWTEKAFNSR